MPFEFDSYINERQWEMLVTYAQKHALTIDEALMKLSDSAEEAWLAEQANCLDAVPLFRRH